MAEVTTANRLRRTSDCAQIAVFLALLCLPAVAAWLGLGDRFTASEKRAPAPMPPLRLEADALAAFPSKFEQHFNDTFGLRGPLIRAHGLVKTLWLNDSSTERVVMGREGWLFYDGRKVDGSDPIADYRGTRPLTSAQVQHLGDEFCRRRDWLAARGIGYLLVIPPNKESLYPEFLPPALARRVGPQAQSPLDQVMAYLAAVDGPPVLDLREELVEAKSSTAGGPVWRKTDSHWTDRGAFIAYQRILQEVAEQIPEVAPAPESDFDFVTMTTKGGDLAQMLGAADQMTDVFVQAVPRRPRRASFEVVTPPGQPNPLITSTVNDPSLPRLVMTRDSYAVQLVPLLAEHFSRAVYVWDHWLDVALVERERPAIVIDQWVERRLRMHADQPLSDLDRAAEPTPPPESEPDGRTTAAAPLAAPPATGTSSQDAGDLSRCTGTLELVDGEQIAGWVWNPDRPNDAVTVEVEADGVVVGTVIAGIYRKDLVDAGKGNGRHGFILQTPDILKDGRRHTVTARVKGGPELASSPTVIGE